METDVIVLDLEYYMETEVIVLEYLEYYMGTDIIVFEYYMETDVIVLLAPRCRGCVHSRLASVLHFLKI